MNLYKGVYQMSVAVWVAFISGRRKYKQEMKVQRCEENSSLEEENKEKGRRGKEIKEDDKDKEKERR